jgi:fatty-acyl-CoA synthase
MQTDHEASARALAQTIADHPTPLAQLRKTASEIPEHPALIFLRTPLDEAPVTLSYRNLLDEVERAARAFVATGIGPDDGIALLLPAVPEAATALIAATAAGVAFPVNPLLGVDALAAQLRLARVKLALVWRREDGPDLAARVQEAAASVDHPVQIVELGAGRPSGDSSIAVRWETFLEQAGNPASEIPERNVYEVAALFHTGGTTGMPKLAQLSAYNLAAAATMAAQAIGWLADDRILAGLPLFHVGGAVDILLSAIVAGTTVIYPTADGFRNRAVVAEVWRMTANTGASVLGGVPTSLGAIADVPLPAAPMDRLRCLLTGGAALPEALSHRLTQLTGKPVYQIYGMTETGGIIAAQRIDGTDQGTHVGLSAPLLRIGFGQERATQPHQAAAELHIAGPNIFLGYRTTEGVTGAPTDGWVATGDLVEVLPSGALKIVGRCKDVIIRSGHNIDPSSIEDVALAHPAVGQAAAVAEPDAYAGEVPVLFVVLRQDVPFSLPDLEQWMAAKVPEPPARPRRIIVVPDMPLTPFGKIARFRLREMAAASCNA